MTKIMIDVSGWEASGLRKIVRTLLFVLAATVVGNAATTGPGFSIDLAHWAANGGWSSQWSVVNTTMGPLACALIIHGPDGQPLSLDTSAGSGSSVSFAVAPGGTAKIQAGSADGDDQVEPSGHIPQTAFPGPGFRTGIEQPSQLARWRRDQTIR